ncbi:MAG: phosphoribosylglycinamide formyltransferase [Pseudomonadota bacterium]
MSNTKHIAILLSGNGSHLQNFIDHYADDDTVCIDVVISNEPSAYGLKRAHNAGIPTLVINHRDYVQREAFDAALVDALRPFNLDVVILAGFMRILTPVFVEEFKGHLFNIHPSLLPKYPGLHTHRRAIEAGDAYAGASVHFVTEELDGGPVVAQIKEAININDTEQTLASRVIIKEHALYPLTIQWFLDGQLHLRGNDAYVNSEKLPPTLGGSPRWPPVGRGLGQ